MGREVLVDSRVGNPSSNSWSCLIGFIACVLHPLILLVMKLFSQILCKWIPISFLLKRLILKFFYKWVPICLLCSRTFLFKFSTNWYPCFFFSRSLWNYKFKIQLMNNSICSKLHKTNSSLKLLSITFLFKQIHCQLTQLIQIN